MSVDFIVWAVILSTLVFSSNWGNYYYSEAFIGCTFGAGILSLLIYKSFHWSVGLLVYYSLMSGIWSSIGINPFGRYDNHYLEKHSLMAMVFLILHFIPFLLPEKDHPVIKKLVLYAPIAFFISCFIIVFKIFFSDSLPSGMINNTSIDPSMIAVCIPLVFYFSKDHIGHSKSKYFPAFVFGLAIISIIACKGSVGVGALIVCLICYAYIGCIDGEGEFYDLMLITALIFSVFITALYHFDGKFFDDSTRFQNYKIFIKYWWENADHLFGTGFGTFWTLGPLSQYQNNPTMRDSFFTWFHSEWMQIIFETGFIGLALSLNVAYHFFKTCLKEKKHEIAIAGMTFCAVMVFNIPFRFFYFSFLGMIILRMGFNYNGNKHLE